ncbi:LysM peptidoglycan-binding domain-containing protein [Nocardioides sp. J54]|uniref:LysM peptidoglycan-binding domain-containing protein n=1 Tax=Nocardioides sp. J54 TaxID=935866 RepID=UPI00048E6563|nr:LysM peptidoglycan-binding domain-containing protein [Nocardioides sp. J54]
MSTISIAPHRVSTARVAPAARRGAQPRAAAPRGQVRLTRRGRVVVFVLGFLVVAALAVAVAAGSAATREDGGAPAVQVVTVAPGETLWDIASGVAAATGGDVRGAMADIQDLNTLDGSMVYAGQQLRIPAAK